MDGTGYPDGLAGEEIPLTARIVFACDALSAMTTRRPYHEAMSIDEALAELVRCSGSQFDPGVVTPLVAIVRAEGNRSLASESRETRDRGSLSHG